MHNTELKFGKLHLNAIAIFLVYLIIAFATLYQLWGLPTWPRNHDGLSFFGRLHIYQQHFLVGDYFPIWSSLDNGDFGSPQPLFYHKLFYFIGAIFLYVLNGNIKFALIASLVFFLLIGAIGIRKLILEIGGSKFSAFCGGLMLITSNYTVTDWLVRGALSETSAAMLVPWALIFFQRTTQTSKVNYQLSFYLTLIFLSHSVICFYLIIFFIFAFALLLALGKLKKSIFNPTPIVISILIFIVLNSPYLIAAHFIAGNYDMSRILIEYQPATQFHAMGEYLFSPNFRWGNLGEGNYTVQLDLPITLIFFAMIGILIFKLPKLKYSELVLSKIYVLLPLTIIFIFSIFLQTKLSVPFYEYVPGAKYIQFPWRLLSVITPIIIVYACYLPNVLLNNYSANCIQLIAVISMAYFCGSRFNYPAFNELVYLDHRGLFSSYGEYKPLNQADVIDSKIILSEANLMGCDYKRTSIAPGEVLEQSFTVDCFNNAVIPFPIINSPLHRVSAFNKDQNKLTQISCETSLARPTLCNLLIPKGKSEITIEMPRLGIIFRK